MTVEAQKHTPGRDKLSDAQKHALKFASYGATGDSHFCEADTTEKLNHADQNHDRFPQHES